MILYILCHDLTGESQSENEKNAKNLRVPFWIEKVPYCYFVAKMLMQLLFKKPFPVSTGTVPLIWLLHFTE
jgi:hypothetical protein